MNWNDHAWAAGLWRIEGAASERCDGVALKLPLRCTLRLCDIWKVRRAPFFLIVAIAAAVAFLDTSNSAAANEPKRVLLVHSFGTASPPFSVESTAFETESWKDG